MTHFFIYSENEHFAVEDISIESTLCPHSSQSSIFGLFYGIPDLYLYDVVRSKYTSIMTRGYVSQNYLVLKNNYFIRYKLETPHSHV